MLGMLRRAQGRRELSRSRFRALLRPLHRFRERQLLRRRICVLRPRYGEIQRDFQIRLRQEAHAYRARRVAYANASQEKTPQNSRILSRPNGIQRTARRAAYGHRRRAQSKTRGISRGAGRKRLFCALSRKKLKSGGIFRKKRFQRL